MKIFPASHNASSPWASNSSALLCGGVCVCECSCSCSCSFSLSLSSRFPIYRYIICIQCNHLIHNNLFLIMLNPHVFDPIAMKNFTCALITHFYSFAIAWKRTLVFMWLRLATSLKCLLSCDRFYFLFSFLLPISLFLSPFKSPFLSLSITLFVFVILFFSHLFWFSCTLRIFGKKKKTQNQHMESIDWSFNVVHAYMRWRPYADHFKSITLYIFLPMLVYFNNTFNNSQAPQTFVITISPLFLPFFFLFHFIAPSSPAIINDTILRFVPLKLPSHETTLNNLNAIHAENTENINIIFNVPYMKWFFHMRFNDELLKITHKFNDP